MVLAAIWRERRDRKIRQEVDAEWEAWLRRWDEAKAQGIPFDEPHPQPEKRRQARSAKLRRLLGR